MDLPPGQEPSTYARQESAQRANMATVVAVPIAKVDGDARRPTAVVIVYFAERLAAAVRRPASRVIARRGTHPRRASREDVRFR